MNKDMKEINETRKHWGIPELQPKERVCLRCHRKFISFGNRLCGCSLPEPIYTINEEAP